VGDEIQRKVERTDRPTHANRNAQDNPSLPAPASLASSGTISPVRVRATAAANWKVLTARAASTRAVLMGLRRFDGDGAGEVLLTLAQQPCGLIEDLRR